MDKKRNELDGFSRWTSENPEVFNMGMGLMKGLQEDRRNAALSGSEIAKTQYGYLTGAGMGNVNNLKMNNSPDRVRTGMFQGMIDRRDSKFQEALQEALQAKKAQAPYKAPNTIKTDSDEASQVDNTAYDYAGGMSEEKPLVEMLKGTQSPDSMMSRQPASSPYSKPETKEEQYMRILKGFDFLKKM